MPLASFLVPTHRRPKLLEAALATMARQHAPPGWEIEIVVAGDERDPGHEVCVFAGATAQWPILYAATPPKKTNVGARRNAALKASRGELVMVADDDDLQSPQRAAAAIAAYVQGEPLSGTRLFHYLSLQTGALACWDGLPDVLRDHPDVEVGVAVNHSRRMLEEVHGWADVPRLVQKELARRLRKRRPHLVEVDLSASISDTICMQHEANIWTDRPFPAAGAHVDRGGFRITGLGHVRDHAHLARRLPNAIAADLGVRRIIVA